MSRNRIEPSGDVKEYTTFTSDVDLTDTDETPIATSLGAHQVRVVTVGAGSILTVVCQGNREQARDLTVADNEVLETAWYTQIVGNKAAFIEGAAETYDLDDGDTLIIETDGTEETATFNTGDFSNIDAATAAEVATVISADTTGVGSDASGTIRITSPTAGTGGKVKIIGGTAVTKLGFTVGQLDLGGDTDVTRVRVGWPSNP